MKKKTNRCKSSVSEDFELNINRNKTKFMIISRTDLPYNEMSITTQNQQLKE